MVMEKVCFRAGDSSEIAQPRQPRAQHRIAATYQGANALNPDLTQAPRGQKLSPFPASTEVSLTQIT